MAVVESALILLDTLYTYLKALSCKLARTITMYLSVDCVNNERPVHHLIAVKKMTIQDESQGSIVLDFVIRRF